MTLASEVNRLQFNGDSSTFSFPVSFIFWDEDDLEVILTDSAGVETIWTRGTEYTISLVSPPNTGTLTVVTTPIDYTPATGETLTIRSNLDNTQPTSLPVGGALPTGTIEQQIDQVVRQIQQVDEQIGRAIKFALTSAQTGIEIADPEAGKIIRWNSAATALENVAADDGTLTVPVGLADGGTGGTSAATALSNLGVKLAAQRVSLWKLGQF